MPTPLWQPPDLAALLAALQLALGTNIACGQITLNLNDGAIQSFETKTFRRVTATKTARTAADAVIVSTVVGGR